MPEVAPLISLIGNHLENSFLLEPTILNQLFLFDSLAN